MATERTVLVRLKADAGPFNRAMLEAASAVGTLHKEIDTTNNRTAWLAQGILAVAPAATTLAAGAVPAIAGLATQMTVGVAAAGAMALAFHGVGTGLTALNTYQLEPTAAHLMKLNEAMAKLGPAGAEFVHFLDKIGPQLSGLSNSARAGMFPGIESGITHLMTLLPQVNRIVSEISKGIGQLANDAGKSLAGPEWKAFFTFLENDAKPILIEMGKTVGNFALGIANMMVAFAPQSKAFSGGLLDMSRSFAQWSRTLDTNQSFQDFLKYVQEAGPKALHFIGALVTAFDTLVGALAPVGQVALPALTELLNIISTIGGTALGPALLTIGALVSAYGRLAAIGKAAGGGMFKNFTGGVYAQTTAAKKAIPTMRELGQATMSTRHAQNLANQSFSTSAATMVKSRTAVTGFMRSMVPAGVAIGALALLVTGASDKMGLSNTAALTLAGTMKGPLTAAALGTVGLFLDARKASEDYTRALDNIAAAAENSSVRQIQALKAQAQAAYDNRPAVEKGANTAVSFVGSRLSAVAHPFGGASSANLDAQKLKDTLASLSIAEQQATMPHRNGLSLLTDQLGLSTHAAKALSSSMKNVEQAFLRMTDVLAGRSTLRDYQAALDAVTAAVKKNGKTLDINTQKGRDNQAALDGIAAASIQAAGHMKGLNRQRFLVQARQDFIDAAKKLGLTDAAARHLSDKLGLLKKPHPVTVDNKKANSNIDDTTRRTKVLANTPWMVGIDADTSNARAGLSFIDRLMNSLDGKTATTYVNTVHTGGMQMGYDSGGYTGRGPKMEVAGVVHRGEVVLTQDIVNRDWNFLKARYGYLPGFAGGGVVGKMTPAQQSMRVDIGNARLTGYIDTPTGPAPVTLTLSDVRHEIRRDHAANTRYENAVSRT